MRRGAQLLSAMEQIAVTRRARSPMLSHGITVNGPVPVFKSVYVARRRMCGAEDDRREERRRQWNGTGGGRRGCD